MLRAFGVLLVALSIGFSVLLASRDFQILSATELQQALQDQKVINFFVVALLGVISFDMGLRAFWLGVQELLFRIRESRQQRGRDA